ncbi:hypothetical protein CJJ07_004551 [Candidozyma auris]|nr:hypothetical protein CJJ07_004551 [[Candida] auris]
MVLPRELLEKPPLNRIPDLSPSNIRYLTFNVNGIKTLFNYHPWNLLQNDHDALFRALKADIISLQELKINGDGLASTGLLKDYRSFVSIPKSRKGYSGVGLFVRVPLNSDPPHVKACLSVVKAEEGITGTLPSAEDKAQTYDVTPDNIGGYMDSEDMEEMNMTFEQLKALDSEGRAAVVELASGTVVFSLYCPANSMGTEEGELFRLRFLEVLLRRCRKLKALGKEVVVMGDINVSLDLIDHAEAINEGIKVNLVKNNLKDGGVAFEKVNKDQCLAFKNRPVRALLQKYVHPTNPYAKASDVSFLYDTTRIIQGRRLAMYTVWNTMTSARQSNYGSRIDLILFSSSSDVDHISKADILPFIHGSDHCPVFTDVDVSFVDKLPPPEQKKISFEAKSFYKLVKHRDISSMFGNVAKRSVTPDSDTGNSSGRDTKKPKLQYVSRKKSTTASAQSKIGAFFTQEQLKENKDVSSGPPQEIKAAGPSVKLDSISKLTSLIYSDPPKCRHGEDCVLKTSLKTTSKGKKFWCCPRSAKGSSTELGEHRCEFFEWAKPKGRS